MSRVVVVSGGTAGIGLATARLLCGAGNHVVITGRDKRRGETALAEVGTDEQVTYVQCDATDRDQVRAVIDDVLSVHGRVDALVNSVGRISHPGFVTGLPDDAFLDGISANVNPAFWASKAVLPHMREAGYGRIVNVSSSMGKTGFPGASVYVAAKHALLGFTKALAAEVAAQGIAVNAVCPGLTDTEMLPREVARIGDTVGMSLAEVEGAVSAATHVGRLVTAEEVAHTTAFLASPAAQGISGAAFNVDGGYLPF